MKNRGNKSTLSERLDFYKKKQVALCFLGHC